MRFHHQTDSERSLPGETLLAAPARRYMSQSQLARRLCRPKKSINEIVKYMNNKDDAKDPWGNDFMMLCGAQAPPAAEGFGILSKGKDGKQGTDDDVKSWEKPTKK